MPEPNRAPSTVWCLRPEPGHGYVRTSVDDLIHIVLPDPLDSGHLIGIYVSRKGRAAAGEAAQPVPGQDEEVVMPTNIERAAAIVHAETGGCGCEPFWADYNKVDPRCGWHNGGEDIAQSLAEAETIVPDDAETTTEYGVRYPTVDGGEEIVSRSEYQARHAVNYHRSPANESAWINDVWLVSRVVSRTAWTKVADDAR